MQNLPCSKLIQIRYSLLAWLILPAIFSYILYSNIISSSKLQAASTESITITKKAPSYKYFDTRGKGALTILFNNAWHSQYEFGFNYLKKLNIKGTVSATSNYVGYPAYWSWQELENAQNNSWEIISQGKNYLCNLNDLTDENITEEVSGSKQDFLTHGIYVKHFASPCGKVDLRLTDHVSENYASQKIGEEGINYLPLAQEYLLKASNIKTQTTLREIDQWILDAQKHNGWLIITFDQIDNLKRFQEIIKHIQDSNIPIVVPSEIIN